jgi:hypothetical protein
MKKNNGRSLSRESKEVNNNSEIFKEEVINDATDEFKNNFDIVMEAVKNEGKWKQFILCLR